MLENECLLCTVPDKNCQKEKVRENDNFGGKKPSLSLRLHHKLPVTMYKKYIYNDMK